MAADSDPGQRMTRGRKALVWVGRALAGLFVLAVVGWVVADVVYGHLLNVRLAELRRAGEPLTVEEVLGPEPPTAENAAPIYTAALGIDVTRFHEPHSLTLGSLNEKQVQVLFKFAYAGGDPAPVQAVMRTAEVREWLLRLRQATERPHCRFPLVWRQGVRETDQFTYPMSVAATLPLSQARLELRENHQAAAVGWLICAMRMARHLGEQQDVKAYLDMTQLYFDVRRVAASTMQDADLTPELTSTLREELRATDVSALAHQTLLESRAKTLQGFAFLENPLSHREMRGSGHLPRANYEAVLLQPFFKAQALYTVAHFQELFQEAQTTVLLHHGTFVPRGFGGLDVLGWMSALNASRVLQYKRRLVAVSSMFSVALALNDYHYAHHAYPDALGALGAALPLDPFSGKPFCYRRAGAGYVLYSVGENGVDDGGRPRKSGEGVAAGDLLWGN